MDVDKLEEALNKRFDEDGDAEFKGSIEKMVLFLLDDVGSMLEGQYVQHPPVGFSDEDEGESLACRRVARRVIENFLNKHKP